MEVTFIETQTLTSEVDFIAFGFRQLLQYFRVLTTSIFGDKKMAVTRPTTLKLTPLEPEYFQILLSKLDEDQEEAGKVYMIQRENVTRIFTQANCEYNYIEELADETFHRVGKYLSDGKEIQKNIRAIIKTTAGHVLHEYWREINKSYQTILPTEEDVDDIIHKNSINPLINDSSENELIKKIIEEILIDKDKRLPHLHFCLDKLTTNNKERIKLISEIIGEIVTEVSVTEVSADEKDKRRAYLRSCLDKFTKDEKARLMILVYHLSGNLAYKLRKVLAEILDMKPGTLRQNLSRIEKKLFDCVNECMKKEAY